MSSPIVTPTDSQDFLSMERSELDQPFDVGPVASENSYFTAPNSNSPAQSRLTRSNQETTDTTTKLNSGLNPWKVVANENTTVRMYGSTPDEPSDSQLAFEEQLKHDPKVVLQNNATSTANLFGTSSNSEMSNRRII